MTQNPDKKPLVNPDLAAQAEAGAPDATEALVNDMHDALQTANANAQRKRREMAAPNLSSLLEKVCYSNATLHAYVPTEPHYARAVAFEALDELGIDARRQIEMDGRMKALVEDFMTNSARRKTPPGIAKGFELRFDQEQTRTLIEAGVRDQAGVMEKVAKLMNIKMPAAGRVR